MKFIDGMYIFESDYEIQDTINSLELLKNSKVSGICNVGCGLKFHNGKPSIPDHKLGYKKSIFLR